mgnify:CR=1 FL=1
MFKYQPKHHPSFRRINDCIDVYLSYKIRDYCKESLISEVWNKIGIPSNNISAIKTIIVAAAKE